MFSVSLMDDGMVIQMLNNTPANVFYFQGHKMAYLSGSAPGDAIILKVAPATSRTVG